ncbi:MAG TPA: hypothetical protein VEB86_10920 [Chryseosolibacter sp.]|nr:hypothetical protein [Chryseosolibacter sp.]
MDKETELRVARHECGHAFVCLALRMKFNTVNIKQDGFYFGSFDMKGQRVDRSISVKQNILNSITISIAGHIADSIHFHMDPAELGQTTLRGSDKDMENIQRLTNALGIKQSDLENLMALAAKRAALILSTGWPLVNRLANELIKKRSLTYEESLTIIGA